MSNRHIIIQMTTDAVHLSPTLEIPMDRTNLPVGDFAFNNRRDHLWKAKMIGYDENKGILQIEVTNYNVDSGSTSVFETQETNKRINYIEFVNLRLDSFISQLSFYTPRPFEELTKIKHELVKGGAQNQVENPFVMAGVSDSNYANSDFKSVDGEYDEAFNVNTEDLAYHDGYITFKKKFPFFNDPIQFRILNSAVRSEFKYIQGYFVDTLGWGDQINVRTSFEIVDGQIRNEKVYSTDVDQINEQLIDRIEFHRVEVAIKDLKNREEETTIVNTQELFESLNEMEEAKEVFSKPDIEVLDSVINVLKVKNRKQLDYLAHTKQTPNRKIHFTLPKKYGFGFLFNVAGKSNNYYCWELLNSNATYIWKYSTQLPIEQIEESIINEINKVQTVGRSTYLESLKAQEDGRLFNLIRVWHTKTNESEEVRFNSWKANMELNLSK